eukprot:12424951-Prorocentrum_lima.AAC.1
MTSSLVGSEMCIRDRLLWDTNARLGLQVPSKQPMGVLIALPRLEHIPRTVSYTHLTLPTICSV